MRRETTTSGMSASELAECRENLKRQWENRQVDKESASTRLGDGASSR